MDAGKGFGAYALATGLLTKTDPSLLQE
jgi:hypothetical protein